jgi:hypothetical protein
VDAHDPHIQKNGAKNTKKLAKAESIMYIKEQDLVQQGKIEELQKNLLMIAEQNARLSRWAVIFEKAQLDDLLANFSSPKRIIYINFLAGLSRGLGLTIGTTLILAFFGYIFKEMISLPIIGQYIADLLDIIDFYRNDH